MPTERERTFAALAARAQACVRCARMAGRRRVLGAGNGPVHARVLFVAEAPGRFGGDRTAVPSRATAAARRSPTC